MKAVLQTWHLDHVVLLKLLFLMRHGVCGWAYTAQAGIAECFLLAGFIWGVCNCLVHVDLQKES